MVKMHYVDARPIDLRSVALCGKRALITGITG